MDPTLQELEAIGDLAGAKDWAGVEAPFADVLMTALGGPTRVRDVALIARPAWDQAVASVSVPTGQDPPQRNLTPVEGARIESFRRVCLLCVGRTPDLPGDQGLPGPVIANPALPPAGGGGGGPGPAGPRGS